MIYSYNEVFMKGLHKFAIRQEIADIKNRHRHISLWLVDFTKKNGRKPTDEEADLEVRKLTEELQALGED